MEWIRLIGIVVVIIGFILKVDTIAVVLCAGLATALVSDMGINGFLTTLGEAFVNNRLVTLFILTLPVVGLSESCGLRQQAVKLIQKIQSLTVGKLLTLYLVLRELCGFFAIRLNSHPQLVRPLIQPMAQASAEGEHGQLDEPEQEKIKASSAAMDNLGNFFAQNTFIAAAGVLLITGTMDSLGYSVSSADVAKASIPIALITAVLGGAMNWLFDYRLRRKYTGLTKTKGGSVND